MEDAGWVIPMLAEKYKLWTVTARQKSGLHVIEHLIEKHIPKCISGIHCVWEHKGKGAYHEISKREFIKNFPGNKLGFIDDSPSEILKVQDILPSYLFDPQGVNDGISAIHYRLRGWADVARYFL